jgi:hypothetical protein
MSRRAELTVKQILAWADAFHARTGNWPERKSGRVWEPADETWNNIDQALRKGLRGLHKGQSLARLLAKHRGKRNRKQLPKYSIGRILRWADNFRALHGRLPRLHDGPVTDTTGETWVAVDTALRAGIRGLRGGSSLAKLLAKKRQAPNPADRPRLTVETILRWCDEHFEKTGVWPRATSGLVPGSEGDTWVAVDLALRRGRRGLRKSSLYQLLARHRGASRFHIPNLTIQQILQWCDEFHARTGNWPSLASGRISGAGRESWLGVHTALALGKRGLPSGLGLGKLLAKERDVRNRFGLPALSEAKILRWARAYKRKHGNWPDEHSGPITGAGGETWSAIRNALYRGGRGLKRRMSLTQLLGRHG